MRLKKWELVLLIAAAVSLAIWGLAHTVGARATNQEGVVERIASPAIAFLGEQVDMEVRIDADGLPTCGTPGDLEPIFAALVIDHSGSMSGDPLEAARNAASDFVQLMNLTKEGDAVTVVMFNNNADLLTGFSYDWGRVVRAIQGISDGGGTNIGAGLALASQQFIANPPPSNARQVLILLSDGQSDPMAAIAAADQAKSQGIRVVTISLGNADRTTLAQIASSETDYYESPDPTTLLEIYGEIAAGMVGTAATDISLVENVNDVHFDLVDTTLYRAQQTSNQIVWQLPFIGQRGRSVGYFLRSRTMGWHKVSPAPGQLSLADCNAQAFDQTTPEGPRVLVLFPVWLLYIFPALALFWFLSRMVQALRPAQISTSVKPGERPDDPGPGKKVKKEPSEHDAAPVTHGQPRKPPKRQDW